MTNHFGIWGATRPPPGAETGRGASGSGRWGTKVERPRTSTGYRKRKSLFEIATATRRGPRKGGRPLWGEEKPRHRWNFPLAENGTLWLVLRRGGGGNLKHNCQLFIVNCQLDFGGFMEGRNQFTFYRSFYLAVKKIPKKDQEKQRKDC